MMKLICGMVLFSSALSCTQEQIEAFKQTNMTESEISTEASVDKNDMNACNADQYMHLIGENVSVLDSMALPENHRIIKPGTPVTRDLRRDRINFIVVRNDIISEIKCF